MSGIETIPPPRKSARLWLLTAAGILVAGGLLGKGIWQRQDTLAGLRSVADEESVPDVHVVLPSPAPATRPLDLPGTIQAWYSAPIYGQVAGYIGMWYKDYGAAVKTGDLLATIVTPSLDQQLATAQANVDVAEAKYKLAVITAKRWKALAGTQAVSQQEVDVNTANAEAARASVEAARAEAARYQAMEGFKNVVAPFDGVVTARSTDVGSYVNATGAADHSSGPASELFMVSDIHKLRVYVSVPQDYSGVLKPGLTATMSLPQFSHQQFHAQFLTTAQAFNPQTRTVVTELTVDNPNNRIWPGTYADVHFVVPGDPHVLVIPEQALLFRAEGLQVAVVRPDNTVHLQNVTLGLNLGKTVQITAGLQPNDRLIDDPSAATLEGEKVRVVPAAAGDDSSSPQGSAGKLSQAGAAGQSPQGGGQEPVHTAQADRAPADTQADTPQADTPQAGTPRAGTPQAGTPQAGGPRSHGSSAP